jgi:hypothetical protein
MGIFSRQDMFSIDQAITADAVSDYWIDLGAPGRVVLAAADLTRDIGPGLVIPIVIICTEVFATIVDLTVTLQVDDNSSFSSPKTVASTGAIARASMVAGYVFPGLMYMPGKGVDERYMRLNYDVNTSATTGKITAGIVWGGHQTN